MDNYPSVSCFLIREPGRDLRADFPLISRGLHMTPDQLEGTLKHYALAPKYEPIPLKQDITPDEVEFIEAHRDELPELETIDEQRRLYPRNGFAANLIGYVGEVSDDMLNDPRYAYYEPGDVVGKSGVEQSYDQLLRGQDGSQDIIVDSHGREVGILGREPAVPGQGLKLTIDLDIQKRGRGRLRRSQWSDCRHRSAYRRGAGVGFTAQPSIPTISRCGSRGTNGTNSSPIRAIRCWTRRFRHNWRQVPRSKSSCRWPVWRMGCGAEHEGELHRRRHISTAATLPAITTTAWSIFFTPSPCPAIPITTRWRERLGIEKIAYWAHKVGIGQKTGIDLPGEVSGTMPSEEWKMKTFHEKWYAGEVISVGIGQGAVAVSPIQLVRAIAGIASGGVFKRPHVVEPDQLPAEYRQAMDDSYPGSGDVDDSHRSGNMGDDHRWDGGALDASMAVRPIAAHLDNIDFAGKTGTAQVVNHSAGMKSRMPRMWPSAPTPGLSAFPRAEIRTSRWWS